MLLATVDAAGQPHARYVLLRGLDADGLRFFTNRESDKARQLDASGRAGATFGWHRRHRQVRVTGSRRPVSRTPPRRLLRLASPDDPDRQLGLGPEPPLASREALEDRVAEIEPPLRRGRRSRGRRIGAATSCGPRRSSSGRASPTASTTGSCFTADGRAGWRVDRLYPEPASSYARRSPRPGGRRA